MPYGSNLAQMRASHVAYRVLANEKACQNVCHVASLVSRSYTQKAKPEENVPKDWDKNDNKAQAKIGLCLEKTQQHLIRKCESAYEMWNILRDYHQRRTLSTKLRLLRKLMKMKLPEGGKMPDHLNEVGSLIDKLEDVGETLSNHLSVALILASLPESYDNLITSLETSKEDDLDLEYVKGKLIDEWQRKNESRSDYSDQAPKGGAK